eukprot:5462571-Prymnesium_polylepis.1
MSERLKAEKPSDIQQPRRQIASSIDEQTSRRSSKRPRREKGPLEKARAPLRRLPLSRHRATTQNSGARSTQPRAVAHPA